MFGVQGLGVEFIYRFVEGCLMPVSRRLFLRGHSFLTTKAPMSSNLV